MENALPLIFPLLVKNASYTSRSSPPAFLMKIVESSGTPARTSPKSTESGDTSITGSLVEARMEKCAKLAEIVL